jgi:preprotein translocase subunit SecA
MAKKVRSTTRVGRGSDGFMLRLPDGMRDFIAEMAEKNGRSMNAEIVNALAHQAARAEFRPVPPSMAEIMNDVIAERIRKGEIQNALREAGQKLEAIAKELDRVVAETRQTVSSTIMNPAERNVLFELLEEAFKTRKGDDLARLECLRSLRNDLYRHLD